MDKDQIFETEEVEGASSETEVEVEVAAEEEVAAEVETEEEVAEAEVDETEEEVDETAEKFAALDTKIVELEQTIATLTLERDNAVSSYSALKVGYDELAAFKKSVEDNEKLLLISSYAEMLPEDIIESFTNAIDSYSLEDLDKELTYAQKKANPNLFGKSKAVSEPALIPKDEPDLSGIASILAKYERK